ncbi:MAG: glycosyl hydrolase 115 family protein, partial [Steroidobacter sp.]
MKPLLIAAAILFLDILSTEHAVAIEAGRCSGVLKICSTFQSQTVMLIKKSVPVRVMADDKDDTAVLDAARNLQADLSKVAGNRIENKSLENSVVIVGTIGHSKLIDQLVREHKLNVNGVPGVWEAYVQQVVQHPTPDIDRALVIAGADRRGTVFGIYTLSNDIGVSPWNWWADVPVQHHDNLYITAGRRIDAPKVRYRGIFLNDEDPSLKGWATEKFGGLNHQFYGHVFELILRLKGNYLWPAMWGKSIYDDDPESPKLANEMGVVLGTSHHEPMSRAHVEWERYGGGTPWDYSLNEDKLKAFWRKGIERMGNNESLITVGMRGDGDEPMSKDTAINLLEKIVHDQREIIADVMHRDPKEVPQVWALYKEVQDYYDQGMKVPDDITLLFSDDNWGNIRRVPRPGDQRRGGYGMYYHFDYVGGPRNYKWINTNQIERTWEQMRIAYEYGIDRIWIVNVGDLKPMEYPISFFLDYAWNPDALQVEQLKEYPSRWSANQFGLPHAREIGEMLTRYTQFNARRKPELLSPETYSLTDYHEAERVVNEYNSLAGESRRIGKLLPAAYHDAYFQLVQYPIEASANLNELYVTAALNKLHAVKGCSDTNELADKVDQLFDRDAELTRQYHALGHGRWNHFMDQTHIGYT